VADLTQTDIAYIAGFFDADGCATCKQKKTKRKDRGGKVYNQWYIRCEISVTDKEVIAWIHETLGFGWSKEKIYKIKRPAHYKRQWRWRTAHRDALRVAKMIYPYSKTKSPHLLKIIHHYRQRGHV